MLNCALLLVVVVAGSSHCCVFVCCRCFVAFVCDLFCCLFNCGCNVVFVLLSSLMFCRCVCCFGLVCVCFGFVSVFAVLFLFVVFRVLAFNM